jgi:hypothetical protein
VAEAEIEAQDTMLRAMSDDMEYWGRISSAVLFDDTHAEHIKHNVAPEFQSFAQTWTRSGRSLDVIQSLQHHASLMESRFDRRQATKERKQAAIRAGSVYKARGSARCGGGGGATRGAVSAVTAAELLAEEIDMTPTTYDVDAALSLLQSIEDVFLSGLDDSVATLLPEIGTDEMEMMAAVYDHMIHCFKHATFKQAFGYNAQDHRQPALVFGHSVPSYFANVVDQSIYRRKVLSMAGLRNLVKFGPKIYEDLVKVKFSGNPAAYQGNVGLNLMREVTGNVVDLDTTVLRCSCKATLNAINASNAHKKEKTFASVDEFAKSAQAMEIAIHCSIPLLDTFAEAVGIKTAAEKAARAIDSTKIVRPIPVASSNTDRGTHPVWHYVNVGQNSFHCNVPNLDDVNGALLRAPYRCAKIWATLVSLYRNNPVELHKRMMDFFENCVVDSCFNMKWKAIEEFESKMQHEGTIVDVLQREQMHSQKLFTVEFFDSDDEMHTKEVELMFSLVEGRVAISTKDARKRVLREITRDDVALWVEDPSVVL